MAKRNVLVVVVVALAILVGLRVGLPLIRPADDQKLIQEALATSIEASREGRPGGVMDLLSRNLKVNDMEPATRSQIAKFIVDSKPDVVIRNDRAVVTGEEARIVTDVDLSVNFLGRDVSRTLKDVSLLFKKEDGTKYLVIPTRKWRLVEVDAPASSIADLMQ